MEVTFHAPRGAGGGALIKFSRKLMKKEVIKENYATKLSNLKSGFICQKFEKVLGIIPGYKQQI